MALMLPTYIIFISFSLPAFARFQETTYWPNGALAQASYEEQLQQRKTEAAEGAALRLQRTYDDTFQMTQARLAEYRLSIDQMKQRREHAQTEAAKLKLGIADLREQVSAQESIFKAAAEETESTAKALAKERVEYEAENRKLAGALADLSSYRARAEHDLQFVKAEIARMRSEKASLDKKVADAESQKSRLQDEEAKSRAEWIQAKISLAEAEYRRNNALAQLEAAKVQLGKTKKELATATTENPNRTPAASPAAEVAPLKHGRRVWQTSMKCKAYPAPDITSQAVGYFESGRKLQAREQNSDWIEISNGKGKVVYVESTCGAYGN